MTRIAICRNEFGETYHLALALAMDPSVSAALIGDGLDAQKRFLGLFAKPDRIATYNTRAEAEPCASARCSTDFYSGRWCEHTLVKMKEKVLRATSCRKAEVARLLAKRLRSKPGPVVLAWVRNGSYCPERNSTVSSTHQLLHRVDRMGLRSICIGNSLDDLGLTDGHLVEFYNDPPFDHEVDRIALQLRMFYELQTEWNLKGSVGMVSGGMDGPALFLGLPTLSLCFKCNHERLKKKSQG